MVVLTGVSNKKISGLLQFGPQKRGRNNGLIVWWGFTAAAKVIWHGNIALDRTNLSANTANKEMPKYPLLGVLLNYQARLHAPSDVAFNFLMGSYR